MRNVMLGCVLLGLGCAATTKSFKAPVLANVGQTTMTVDFKGAPLVNENLYVCLSDFSADSTLTCIDYEFFQIQLMQIEESTRELPPSARK